MKIKVVQTPRIKIVNPAPPPAELTVYPVGPRGEPGPGVPTGGTAGQVLKKIDDTDYNTEWQNEAGASPVVGLSQVAFGEPSTGALTSSPYFTFYPTVSGVYSRLSLGEVGARSGQVYTWGVLGDYSILEANYLTTQGDFHLRPSFASAFLFRASGYFIYTDPGEQSFVQLAPYAAQLGHYSTRIGFFGNVGGGNPNFFELTTDNVVKVRGFSTNVQMYGGLIATDIGFRLDQYGGRFGYFSTLSTPNSYQFEVQGGVGQMAKFGGIIMSDNYAGFSDRNGIQVGGWWIHNAPGSEQMTANTTGTGQFNAATQINFNTPVSLFYGQIQASTISPTAFYASQGASSSSPTGIFFKPNNGGQDVILHINRGDGTSPSGFANPGQYAFISFGLADGFSVFGTQPDRVKIGAEYESTWTAGNASTLFTSFVVQTYNTGTILEKFRVTPFGIRLTNGAAPASPVNGDVWFDGADLKMRIAGSTKVFFDVVNETPSGLINGSNATFTTAFNFDPGTEEVYLNGLKLVKLEDYNTTGTNQIDLYVSPGAGEHLIVNYKKI